MEYVRVISAPTTRKVVDSARSFGKSHKGPVGGVAFVWSSAGHLYMHEHGVDNFVHASAMQGKKVRCSGMMVVINGKVVRITDESGHYAPQKTQIFFFADWLEKRGTLDPNGHIVISNDPDSAWNDPKGFRAIDFLSTFRNTLPSVLVPYLT